MSEPQIAARTPAVFEIEPGTYYWCACGRSQNQPWCDGSHKGTEFSPHEIVFEEAKRVAMCCCKRTGNSPFCDGTHKNLSE